MIRAALLDRLDAYAKLLRLDKPIGTLLLLWPTLWALWLSADGVPQWKVLLIFVVGTLLMRSAGCAINDYADRDFDQHVARTRNRPLATGRVTPVEALVLAALLAAIALALVLMLNRLTVLLALVAAFLAVSYPLTKRFFVLPQAYLGLAFGFGIPMAYAAQLERVPAIAWGLLGANILWTIAYDTEYAMVDRDDDRNIGIRTAAILFGRMDVIAVIGFQTVFLLALGIIGGCLDLAWPYYAGLAVAVALVVYQYRLIRSRQPARCFRAFLNNNWVGAAVFGGIALALALRHGL
jgi:4-hydroxybenzoate polyprenyltransferase